MLAGANMEPMNLLVVERDADWSQWGLISRGLGRAVLVLVQQADETSLAFHERIARRLQRDAVPPIDKVVVLSSTRSSTWADPSRVRLFAELGDSAANGLRIYPHVTHGHPVAVHARNAQLELAG
jgi:hypothetical protein